MIKRGFSLLELMVVIAIIAFLSMLAVPSFNQFMAKTKRTEAYMNLRAIYASQKAYYAEHGHYIDKLFGQNSAGWRPEGYHGGGTDEKCYYTYGFGHGAEGMHYFTGKLQTSHSHLSSSKVDKDSFLILAAGEIGNNGKVDILSVDQNNTIKIVQDGVAG